MTNHEARYTAKESEPAKTFVSSGKLTERYVSSQWDDNPISQFLLATFPVQSRMSSHWGSADQSHASVKARPLSLPITASEAFPGALSTNRNGATRPIDQSHAC